MKRKAVIDIGTNTFNLLIADVGDKIKILKEEKRPVKLGKGSMVDGMIKEDAIERAVNTINDYNNKARDFHVDEVIAFATSAVRSAKNGQDFIKLIKEKCNTDVQIISGDKEAELIYKGVKHAINLNCEEIYLILDIGGGSNEFILCNREKILWKKSYNLGITRLIEKISPSDPITKSDIKALHDITNLEIEDLKEQCKIHKPSVLLGASGSFETYTSMILYNKYGNDDIMKEHTSLEIFLEDFYNWYKILISSIRMERKKIPGLPEWRIDLIVPAIVFTEHIIKTLNIKKIIFSDYSMKEGVVFELKA